MSEEQDICRRYFVSGRVQGVWYRAHCRDAAEKLGITGYAKNLPDGRVEVLACGPRQVHEDFLTALRRGPPAAHVSDLQTQEVFNCPLQQGFRVA